jgi:hypothetical protein
MTLEEFREKYCFANNMNIDDIVELITFLMVIMLETRLRKKADGSKLMNLIHDAKELVMEDE